MIPTFVGSIAPWLLAAALPLLAFALVPAKLAKPDETFVDRVVAVDNARNGRTTSYLAPASLVVRLERNLGLAGLTGVWAIQRLVLAKNLLGAGALVFTTLFFIASPAPFRLLIAVLVTAVAYLAPDLVVWGRAQERQDKIRNELADTLDQITISIEAGLGLETAVARAGQHGSGPLAEELVRTIQDMQVGLSRREAYIALGERTSVTDLKRFARAIMQADQYGISVGNVVRTQAKEMRTKRRQRAEEKAMKIPVKVLFPLMLCILPVLFIVILGPAAINLLSVFSQLGN